LAQFKHSLKPPRRFPEALIAPIAVIEYGYLLMKILTYLSEKYPTARL
jgi:hypothetical protein